MAYENGIGFKRVKVVDGASNKTFIKVKQVDDTSVKNYINVKESEEVTKDYTEVQVVTYDSPKDYFRVNFLDGGVTPEPTERWYWKLNGSSYAEFTDQFVIVDSFSHKFKGVFPRTSFHLMSDNRNSTDRVFLSSSSYRLFGPATAIVMQLTQAEFESITDGSVVELEYGRDDTGTWFINRNGVALGTAVDNYGNNFTLNAFGDLFGGSTGIPRFAGVHWDHTIRTRDRTAVIPFDEAFSASSHDFKNSAGDVIGTKYNDVSTDYTTTEPS